MIILIHWLSAAGLSHQPHSAVLSLLSLCSAIICNLINISFKLFTCWLRRNPFTDFLITLTNIGLCHLNPHPLELLLSEGEGDGPLSLPIPVPGEEVLPNPVLILDLQPGAAELLKEPRGCVGVGVLPIPVPGGAEALHPGCTLAAPLDVLGGDVGGQVLGEHELGEVEEAEDTLGERIGGLIGNLGNFRDFPIISGHLCLVLNMERLLGLEYPLMASLTSSVISFNTQKLDSRWSAR